MRAWGYRNKPHDAILRTKYVQPLWLLGLLAGSALAQ